MYIPFSFGEPISCAPRLIIVKKISLTLGASITAFLLLFSTSNALAAGDEEALRRCLMASKDKPCKVEGYAGSFPHLNDPALNTNLNGCYDFNFTRRADALSLKSPAQCPDDRWPIYVDVRKTTHCPNDKEGTCETGSYVRAQVVYFVQGSEHVDGKGNSKFGYIKLPQSIPWILSATTVLDRVEEVCNGLKSQRYEWNSSTRSCTKKPEYICEDLGLQWKNGACQPPSLICADSKCSDQANYCSGYLYRPQNDWCFCRGSKTDGRCSIPVPPAAPPARSVPVQCEYCSHPRMRAYQDPDGMGPYGPKKKCNCRCKEELIRSPYNLYVWDNSSCDLVCPASAPATCTANQDFIPGECRCQDRAVPAGTPSGEPSCIVRPPGVVTPEPKFYQSSVPAYQEPTCSTWTTTGAICVIFGPGAMAGVELKTCETGRQCMDTGPAGRAAGIQCSSLCDPAGGGACPAVCP